MIALFFLFFFRSCSFLRLFLFIFASSLSAHIYLPPCQILELSGMSTTFQDIDFHGGEKCQS